MRAARVRGYTEPMRALVQLRLPDGTQSVLGPGDLIGRTWTAALQIDDPRVSEAHALVSLRGQELWLLALRGRFQVDGQPSTDVVLVAGQRLRLSPSTELVVDSVTVPDEVLAVEAEGLPRQVLAGTCSLVLWPHPRLLPGEHPEAVAVLWSSGEGWRVRPAGQPARPLRAGDALTLGATTLRAVGVALDAAGQERTRAREDAPLTVVTRYDTVHLLREGEPALVLSGHAARLLSELAAMGGSAPWEVVARELWPDDMDRELLRRRWDVSLVRLRDRLRGGGVRPDLVRPSRNGMIELVLNPGDRLEDRS